MITSHETDYDTDRYSQGAFPYPLETWGDWMQKFGDPEPYLYARQHRAEEVVEHYFHVLARILAIQREVALSVVHGYPWIPTKPRPRPTPYETAEGVRSAAAAPKRDMHDGAKEPAVKKI
ncbi:MAG: hypothetical protein ACRDRW_01655 [Pseudonocardiaceae bacterium]